MKSETLTPSFILLFIFLSICYYSVSITNVDDGSILLTVATFTFAIFTGFFISREYERYTKIRDRISAFDGLVSAVYRNFGYWGSDVESRIGNLIRQHYDSVISKDKWDAVLSKDTTFISDIHKLLKSIVGNDLSVLQIGAMESILGTLADLQVIRKEVITAREERLPTSQWAIVYVLTIVLLLALSLSIFSYHILLASMIKAAFGASIVFVVVLLHRLRGLHFFEKIIGEHSGQDVLHIINSKV